MFAKRKTHDIHTTCKPFFYCPYKTVNLSCQALLTAVYQLIFNSVNISKTSPFTFATFALNI